MSKRPNLFDLDQTSTEQPDPNDPKVIKLTEEADFLWQGRFMERERSLIGIQTGRDVPDREAHIDEKLEEKRLAFVNDFVVQRLSDLPEMVVDLHAGAATAPDTERRMGWAREVWDRALPVTEGPAHTYFTMDGGMGRADDRYLRCSTGLKYQPKDGKAFFTPALVAAMRSVTTGEITAVNRIFLTEDGKRFDSRVLGVAAGSAVILRDLPKEEAQSLIITPEVETAVYLKAMNQNAAVWATGSMRNAMHLPEPAYRHLRFLTIVVPNLTEDVALARSLKEAWSHAMPGRDYSFAEVLTYA